MKLTPFRSLLLAFAGCVTAPAAIAALPDCISQNYDPTHRVFTIKDLRPGEPNQQCLLTVWPRGQGVSGTRVTAGRYLINLSDGGDGGAGGTLQDVRGGGGGGGGGGAGGKELERVVELTEGVYKLTIGAGGPGGTACIRTPNMVFSGGPGWLGSPSSLARVSTGEVVIGTPGADTYVRASKSGNEKTAGNQDGHGGSGPGKASGGGGGHVGATDIQVVSAKAGESRAGNAGGDPGITSPASRTRAGDSSASGGGGGASTRSEGGDGGGEVQRHWTLAPERGALGSGGGGGEGTQFICSPGAPGGNGFMALRRAEPRTAETPTDVVLPGRTP